MTAAVQARVQTVENEAFNYTQRHEMTLDSEYTSMKNRVYVYESQVAEEYQSSRAAMVNEEVTARTALH